MSSNAVNEWVMPNRHRFFVGNRCFSEGSEASFGIPNTLNPPYFGRSGGSQGDTGYPCSTIRMGGKGDPPRQKTVKLFSLTDEWLADLPSGACRAGEYKEGCCRESPPKAPLLQRHPDRLLPGIAFLTRPSTEVLLVPLGLSDPVAVRAARPPGHAPTLLG